MIFQVLEEANQDRLGNVLDQAFGVQRQKV